MKKTRSKKSRDTVPLNPNETELFAGYCLNVVLRNRNGRKVFATCRTWKC
jgi:hypothetical protein